MHPASIVHIPLSLHFVHLVSRKRMPVSKAMGLKISPVDFAR